MWSALTLGGDDGKTNRYEYKVMKGKDGDLANQVPQDLPYEYSVQFSSPEHTVLRFIMD